MDNNKNSGIFGIIGLLVCAGLFLMTRTIFPVFAKLLLILCVIATAALMVLIIVVIFMAFQKPAEEKEKTDVNKMLSAGRELLMDIRRISMRMKDKQNRLETEEICKSADKVLKTLKEQPENMGQVRKLFSQYLPTLRNVLLKCEKLEAHGELTEEIKGNTKELLTDMKTVVDKLYHNMFEDEKMDLDVEIEVLKMVCKKDGLMTEEDWKTVKTDSSIES